LTHKLALFVFVLALLLPTAAQAQPRPTEGLSIFVLKNDTCVRATTCVRGPYTWLDHNGLWTTMPPHPDLVQALWGGGILYFSTLAPISRITFTYQSYRGARATLGGVEIVLPASQTIRRYSVEVQIPRAGHWLIFRFSGASMVEVDAGLGWYGA
jgi:hypothetical protein